MDKERLSKLTNDYDTLFEDTVKAINEMRVEQQKEDKIPKRRFKNMSLGEGIIVLFSFLGAIVEPEIGSSSPFVDAIFLAIAFIILFKNIDFDGGF